MARAKPKRKRGGRHRGAESRANSDLQAHIDSLGLGTVGEYRRWCRERGFTGALTKTWQERRQERQSARKAGAEAEAEAQVNAHIEALGLDGVDTYRDWCRQHDLGDALHKSARQRHKELELLTKLRGESALARGRAHSRKPAETIGAIFAGRIREDELKADNLRRLHAVATAADPGESRDALRQLLLHVERRADLLDTSPVISRFGATDGNTFIDGLAALSRHSRHWFRQPQEWRPDSHNPRRQFGSLARHLLTEYDVPAFMDSAWFRGDTQDAFAQQEWFRHIGGGQNIRTASIPVSFTKKMAHCFLEAPDSYTAEEALRWGQILGQDGDPELVEAVVATPLGESFQHEDFWSTVVHWLVENPMLDPVLIGPIVDYIQHQKYELQQIATPGGGVEHRDPRQPNFSMKSRSPLKLLRNVEQWHDQLARETRIPATQWEHADIGEFALTEDDRESGLQLNWSIRELVTTKELNAEGRAMHHCVRSYVTSCRKGKTAIFSLQVTDSEGFSTRLMTIAVNPRTRQVTQARGRFNARPNASFAEHQKRRSLGVDYRQYLRRSRAIMRRWVEQEDLLWDHRG